MFPVATIWPCFPTFPWVISCLTRARNNNKRFPLSGVSHQKKGHLSGPCTSDQTFSFLLKFSFKNIFSASSVLPWHLFCFALFWLVCWFFFLVGGGCSLRGDFCHLITWCLLFILVPFCLWGFILQFGSHHSGNLRILMSESSYLKFHSDHCRCWEPLWGIWGFFFVYLLFLKSTASTTNL